MDENDDYMQSIEDRTSKFSSLKQLVAAVATVISVDDNVHGVVHYSIDVVHGVEVDMEVGVLPILQMLYNPKISPKYLFIVQKTSPIKVCCKVW